MKTLTKTTLKGGMLFSSETASGHTVLMDALPKVGGNDEAARPAELPFVGLSGCTGMDVISVLRKMRQEPDKFEIEIQGVDATTEYPKYWREINVIFHVEGDIDPKKLTKAIDLSRNRYCGVSAIMKGKVTVHYKYTLNGETVDLPDSSDESEG